MFIIRFLSTISCPVLLLALILSVQSDSGSIDVTNHIDNSSKTSDDPTAVLNPEFLRLLNEPMAMPIHQITNISSESKSRQVRQAADPTQDSNAGSVKGKLCQTDDDCNDDDFACFNNRCRRDTANRRARQAARLERQRQKALCRSNPQACAQVGCQSLFDCPNRQPCINGQCSTFNQGIINNQGATNTAGRGGDGVVVVNIVGPQGGNGGSVVFNPGK